MPAAPVSQEPPRHPLPEWYDQLKAKSFADGQAKYKKYVKNAEANLKKARTHPVDPDRFRDTKYSSAAGQYGYVAAMILVDGFLASYLQTLPLTSLPVHDESGASNLEKLEKSGMNGKIAYNRLLKSVFGTDLSNLFNSVYSKLHIVVHYQHSDEIGLLKNGFEDLAAFETEFTRRAADLLRAYGIVDGKHSKPSPGTQGTGS